MQKFDRFIQSSEGERNNAKKILTYKIYHNKKLRDLLEFPCDFTFKVMGVHREGLVEDIVSVAQVHVKGDYLPREQRSSKAHIIQFLSTFWQKILSKLKP